MSKRQRDEANVSSMQAILGDVPVATIENLLYRSNNNVEAALNLYFTSPVPTIPAATAKSASSTSSIKSKPSPASKAFQGKKYYIGDLVITGWSLLKGPSPMKQGDTITIVRDKVSNSSNKIVRFAVNGREVGRLPREVAQYISTLLDQKLCVFEGSLVWCEPMLKIGDDVILAIKCYLLPSAMHTNSFSTSYTPPSKKRSFDRSIQDPEVLRKFALIQMFRNLGMRPARSAMQNMKIASGDNVWDLLLQSASTKEEDSTETDESLNVDEEERKDVSDGQLDTIYEKAQVFDSQIEGMDQPETMALELKEYQKRALAWMYAKEAFEHHDGDLDMRSMHPLWEEYIFPDECVCESKFFYFNPYSGELSLEFPEANSQERGGILADEMGLGKTIEILSLLHTNRFNKNIDSPNKQSPKSSPTTLIVCPMSLLAQWRDEIIRGSKPNTISVEVFYGDERSKSSSYFCSWNGTAPDVLVTTYGVVVAEWNKVQASSTYITPLFDVEFWRVVLDEAHQIKNKSSKTSLACKDIKAKRRWAVTGTPIQNKLEDLYSLVRFLKHQPWSNHTFWRTFITVPFQKQDPSALTAVQTVLEPIVLRRTKTMRDRQGQLMVPLPPKTINIEYLSFTPEEQDIYDAIYNDSQIKFSYFCQAGKLGKNYASIFQLLTRLRQICCHPYLALQSKEAETPLSQGGKGITLEDLIANHSNTGSSSSAGTEKLSQSEGSSSYGLSVLKNMLALQQGSAESHITDSPMSNLTEECPICFESPESMIALPCMHITCRPCVMDYFQKKEEEGVAGECPVCRHGPILQSELLEIGVKSAEESDATSVNNDQPDNNSSQLKNKNIRFNIRKAIGGFKPSSKMSAMIKHLRQYRSEGLKTVVFSQFTSFLDLIGEALNYESIHFTRLDGTQSQAVRETVLSSFSSPGENGASVLLISLRAGGVGLNLTCANRVIMMDPWWNFSIEAQAIDRVHRLGQSKEVVVTRFVMRDSVEERILEIQNRKHALVNELYQSKDEAKNSKFDDLQILFGKSRKL